ncbi:hypothetical protein F2P81_012571 [Scophthalmus maximus]|uniref:Hyaluronidase n=1 Tax=Scophthalmus maximus TaxID=52904 RepID=A0A6A4SL34_SCOMX|nr:hypothetical protein F2P81_012571 [Scophthalmus maximus]
MLHRTLCDWKVLLLMVLLWDCLCALEQKPTQWPLYSKKPLLLAWNVPTEDCAPRHGISFQLDQFQIVASPNEAFVRQDLTIFYKNRLGLYPYFEPDGTPVNGGLPQVASLSQHLEKMQDMVQKYIRETGAKGLAVIDWEEWRPLWIRNWETKDVYRRHSQELVRQKNPTWPPEQVTRVAQQEFEMSARKFMLETLRQAKNLRPNQLWGFYLFPDCYNHDYRRTLENYTGRCPDVEVARNEQLKWLWTESTALFPSIYMGTVLRSSASGRQFVRNRVREGMRLASSGDGLARPVFVYTRPTYANSLEQLTETDLVSTIGESVALGAAGIILWGDAGYTSSKTSCSDLEAYLRGPLSQYLVNVSTAAELCSQTVCGSHGRCLRRNPDSDVYLHLNPLTHSITRQNGKPAVTGMCSSHPAVLLLLNGIILVSGLRLETASFSQGPFLAVWNAPTLDCLSQHGVDLNLETFNIVQNQNQVFMGDNITIFYADKLGRYPRYSSQGGAVHGGVPQNASLEEHLRGASEDIRTYIPHRDFQGLAVVDWESWRPVWERNWDSKQVYWEASRALVRSRHPDWGPAQVDAAARLKFEAAGRKFMEDTLKLGREERPNGMWGYYGFPDCYNYYNQGANYTGTCPSVERRRNNELLWLWNSSSALYPDIYLSLNMRGLSREVFLYTHHRILEAMRVGAQEHLVYTIGESAALGSAGVVLWGDHAFSKSQATCEAVKFYIEETLGPYLVNVTSAAALCSQIMCSSQGRCQRRDPNSGAYLHLHPAAWKVVSERRPHGGNRYRVLGRTRAHEVTSMKSAFQCKCFPGWSGESCSEATRG